MCIGSCLGGESHRLTFCSWLECISCLVAEKDTMLAPTLTAPKQMGREQQTLFSFKIYFEVSKECLILHERFVSLEVRYNITKSRIIVGPET